MDGMRSSALRTQWLGRVSEAMDLSASEAAELRDELSRFAALFDHPDELERDSVVPVGIMLRRCRQAELYEEVLRAFSDATPYPIARAWALANIGEARFDANDFGAALDHLSEARDLFADLRDDEGVAKCLIHIADIARLSGSSGDVGIDARALPARAAEDRQVRENPADLYREALRLTTKPARRQRVLLSMADLHLSSNEIPQAIAACREALAVGGFHHDISMRRWVIDQALSLAYSFKQRALRIEAREIAQTCQGLCDRDGLGLDSQTEFTNRIAAILAD